MAKFLLVVVLFAVVVYGVLRLLERRGGSGTGLGPRPRRPAGPARRTLAPDDDEEFLRGLNRRRRPGRDDSSDPGRDPSD